MKNRWWVQDYQRWIFQRLFLGSYRDSCGCCYCWRFGKRNCIKSCSQSFFENGSKSCYPDSIWCWSGIDGCRNNLVYVVNMASISKNIFDIYSSTFYQCVVFISLIIILGYMILEICTGSFYYKNALINIWALITCLTYIIGKNNKYKYIIMWIVLFSQIMLALWVAK